MKDAFLLAIDSSMSFMHYNPAIIYFQEFWMRKNVHSPKSTFLIFFNIFAHISNGTAFIVIKNLRNLEICISMFSSITQKKTKRSNQRRNAKNSKKKKNSEMKIFSKKKLYQIKFKQKNSLIFFITVIISSFFHLIS